MSTKPLTHYIVGSGSHGCLYDNGPHAHATYQAAVDDLAETFSLGRVRKARLFADRYLELKPDDGAQYCEIRECKCLKPWEHNEDDNPANWPEYQQPQSKMFAVIVSNIGTVYTGTNEHTALTTYNEYCFQSRNSTGCRAFGESVTLMADNEIIKEYDGEHLGN